MLRSDISMLSICDFVTLFLTPLAFVRDIATSESSCFKKSAICTDLPEQSLEKFFASVYAFG